MRIEILKNEFEAKGPEQVKVDLTKGVYGSNDSSDAQLARVFIEKFEAEEERAFRESEGGRSAKAVSLVEDANEILREANDIATESNRIARRAHTFAGWALFISLLAIIVAIAM